MTLLNKVNEIVEDVITLGGRIPLEWAAPDPISGYIHTHWVNPPLNYGSSPTYASNTILNTVSEGIFVSRLYGKCKVGGEKMRWNEPDDSDLRVLVGHCMGTINNITAWTVNDIDWGDLTGSHTKTFYNGSRTQTADARFAVDASAYRGIAYTAFTFEKDDQQIGYNPNITVIAEGLLCAPLAGGADAFTRNPAVILYDWYLNVEGYESTDLDVLAFQSLEEHCNEVPTGGTLPRYLFDYNFDANESINDAKRRIWASFNGCCIISQGKIKPVWDSGQVADGAGSLTAKTSSFDFTEDNIIKGSLTRNQPERYNLVRVYFKDSDKDYDTTSVYEHDESDIEINGETPYEETCYYITEAELARRRAKFLFNKFKYTDYECSFSTFSSASKLELYDLITITHSLPGWSGKQFIVLSKQEDQYGITTIKAAAYYAGMYDDAEVSAQANNASNLPNPYATPIANSSVSSALVSTGTGFDYNSVKVTVTKDTGNPFYSYSEVYVSINDSNYEYAGDTDESGELTVHGIGTFYVPGDTVYIRTVAVNVNGIKSNFPAAAEDSIAITGYIRLGSFYASEYDFYGGNASISHADTTVVFGNLNGTPKMALGASADSMTLANFATYPGFYVDGTGSFRGGNATSYLQWNVVSGELTIEGAIIASTSDIAGTASDTYTINSDLDNVSVQLIFGRTTGGNLTIDWNGTLGSIDKPFAFDSTVGIGTDTPLGVLDITADGSNPQVFISAYGGTASLLLYGTNGTKASPSATLTGDVIGQIVFQGWDTNRSTGAVIKAEASADWGTAGDISDSPTKLTFWTTPDGSGAEVLRGEISSSGNVYLYNDLYVDGGNILTSSGNLSLDPAGNLIFNPTGGGVSVGATGVGELTAGSINRTSGTFTIEIGGTAEISVTSTASTFGGNLIIPNAGYIGSASDTDALQIEADGDIVLSQDLYVNGGNLSTSAGSLVINPAVDLYLSPAGSDVLLTSAVTLSTDNFVSQTTGWQVSYAGVADFREIYADELFVKAFTAEVYSALAGGIIITKSRAELSRDFTIPNTSASATLYVSDLEGLPDTAVFVAGDYIRLRVIDRSGGGLVVTDVYGTVASYSDLSGGEQSWTFTTTTAGYSSADVIYTGSVVLDYGQTGSGSTGVWEVTVLDPSGNPYSQVQTWDTVSGGEPSNFTTWVRTGNLDGLSGVGLEYGLYAGQGLTTSDPYILMTDQQVSIHNIPITIHDGIQERIKLDASVPSFAIGDITPSAFLTGDGIWMGNDSGTYKFRVGDVDGEIFYWDGSKFELGVIASEHIEIDGTSILFKNSTTTLAELNGSVWTLGDTSNEYVKISTTGFEVYDGVSLLTSISAGAVLLYDSGGTDRLRIDLDGVRVGDVSNEHISITTAGFRVYDGATLYATYGATTTIGLTASEHISISSTSVQFLDGVTVYTDLTAGILTLGDSNNEHVIVNTSGMTIYDGSTEIAQFGSTIYLGDWTVGDEFIQIDSNGIEITSGGVKVIDIDGSGVPIITVGVGGKVSVAGHNTTYASYEWAGSSYKSNFYTNGTGGSIWLKPDTDNIVNLFFSDYTAEQYRTVNITASETVVIRGYYDTNNYSGITANAGNETSYTQIQAVNSSYNAVINFRVSDLSFASGSDKLLDLGLPSYAWDDVYGDDFNNVADIPFFDDRDDLSLLNGIKGSGTYDERTGFEIIDDDTLPDCVKAVSKNGKKEILLDPDGKPYFTVKAIIGLLRGGLSQLDRKYEAHLKEYH